MKTSEKIMHFFYWCSLKLNIPPHELRAMFQFFEGLQGSGLLNNEQIKEYLTEKQVIYAEEIYNKYINKQELENPDDQTA